MESVFRGLIVYFFPADRVSHRIATLSEATTSIWFCCSLSAKRRGRRSVDNDHSMTNGEVLIFSLVGARHSALLCQTMASNSGSRAQAGPP